MDKQNTRHITLAYFDRKVIVDYIEQCREFLGLLRQRMLCKDLPLVNIHPHQVAFGGVEFEKQKGISSIHFSADNVLLSYFTQT